MFTIFKKGIINNTINILKVKNHSYRHYNFNKLCTRYFCENKPEKDDKDIKDNKDFKDNKDNKDNSQGSPNNSEKMSNLGFFKFNIIQRLYILMLGENALNIKLASIDNKKTQNNQNNPDEDEEVKLLLKMSLLEQMEYLNKNHEHDKVIELYNSLFAYSKHDYDGFLTVQKNLAEKRLNIEIKKLNTFVEEEFGKLNILEHEELTKDDKLKTLSLQLGFFILFVLVGFLIIVILKSTQNISTGAVFQMTSEFSKIKFAKDINERLDNVKGIDEVKEEIQQIVSMIKNPNKYYEAGAKLHKGILLCGKPGTGKTLIARAIAGEAGVNFIYLSGSDFDEMFVGVGASKMRNLFQMARKNTPCIIFIDEIDTLLNVSRRSYESSSSRATLNQFLAEMDGFDKFNHIFVIGATNNENQLDPAAVRPGRFDKKIHINIPDEDGRTDLIKFYLSKITMQKENLDSKYIAKLTPGFTGAEIENLVNLSVIHAINRDKLKLDMEDFYEARDRVLMGIPRKIFSISEKKRYHTSLHEAGHTLMCYKSPLCRKTLHKVTIIPRGAAAGVTLMLSDEESLNSKFEFITNIDTAMGGHVAEELMYGSDHVTAGCSSDLNKATQIAQAMVKQFGMYGEKVGYIYVEDEGYSWVEDDISDKYKSKIDETVKNVLKESHDRVYNSLKQSANELKNIAQKLYQYDTLNFDEIEAAIEGRDSDIKRELVRIQYDDHDSLENKNKI